MTIASRGRGLTEFTRQVLDLVGISGIDQGLCTVFIAHTSASLVLQENADPSAREDLERWFDRHVPDNDPLFTHTSEGPDDMPAHVKAALTQTSIGIPIVGGKLALGTWQGIFLWEHRSGRSGRHVIVSIIGE